VERNLDDAGLKWEGLVGGGDRGMAEGEVEIDGEREQKESGEKAEES
jgi:hypothetical protein